MKYVNKILVALSILSLLPISLKTVCSSVCPASLGSSLGGIWLAIDNKNIDEIKKIIKKSTDDDVVNKSDPDDNYTPLSYACRLSDFNVIKFLLENGAKKSINTEPEMGSPIEQIIYEPKNKNILILLLKYGSIITEEAIEELKSGIEIEKNLTDYDLKQIGRERQSFDEINKIIDLTQKFDKANGTSKISIIDEQKDADLKDMLIGRLSNKFGTDYIMEKSFPRGLKPQGKLVDVKIKTKN